MEFCGFDRGLIIKEIYAGPVENMTVECGRTDESSCQTKNTAKNKQKEKQQEGDLQTRGYSKDNKKEKGYILSIPSSTTKNCTLKQP